MKLYKVSSSTSLVGDNKKRVARNSKYLGKICGYIRVTVKLHSKLLKVIVHNT